MFEFIDGKAPKYEGISVISHEGLARVKNSQGLWGYIDKEGKEVINGVCERCGSEVVRKVKSQWMLKITEYADKLIQGLDSVDYIERVKVSQRLLGVTDNFEYAFKIFCDGFANHD